MSAKLNSSWYIRSEAVRMGLELHYIARHHSLDRAQKKKLKSGTH